MNERIKTHLRQAVFLTIPVLAIACHADPKKSPVQPPVVQTEPQSLIPKASSQLSPERQQFLKEARNNNSGAIFFDITDYDPKKDLYVNVREIDPTTKKAISQHTSLLVDSKANNHDQTVIAAAMVPNCKGTFFVGIGFSNQDFYALGFPDAEGNVTTTFTLDQNECFKLITIPVKSLLNLPSPNPTPVIPNKS